MKIVSLISLVSACLFSQLSFAHHEEKLEQAFAIVNKALAETIKAKDHPLLTSFVRENAPKVQLNIAQIKETLRGGICFGQTAGKTPILNWTDNHGNVVKKEAHAIKICRYILISPPEVVAQVILHEAAHYALIENECLASEMEYATSIIGGLSPIDSGYLQMKDDILECAIDGSNFTENFGHALANLLNIRNADTFDAWHLRSMIAIRGKVIREGIENMAINSYGEEKVKIFYNTQDFKGFSPLMLAVIYQDKKWVKKILKHSFVDVNLKSAEGLTALDYAKKGKSKVILEIIEASQK